MKQKFVDEHGSKAVKYKQINPELKVHQVYKSVCHIEERKRVVFTKFRLSSHSLKIETGRWARIDPEERLCDCGEGVQDESHVVFDCKWTELIRVKYGISNQVYNDISDLMERHDFKDLVNFIDECMKQF